MNSNKDKQSKKSLHFSEIMKFKDSGAHFQKASKPTKKLAINLQSYKQKLLDGINKIKENVVTSPTKTSKSKPKINFVQNTKITFTNLSKNCQIVTKPRSLGIKEAGIELYKPEETQEERPLKFESYLKASQDKLFQHDKSAERSIRYESTQENTAQRNGNECIIVTAEDYETKCNSNVQPVILKNIPSSAGKYQLNNKEIYKKLSNHTSTLNKIKLSTKLISHKKLSSSKTGTSITTKNNNSNATKPDYSYNGNKQNTSQQIKQNFSLDKSGKILSSRNNKQIEVSNTVCPSKSSKIRDNKISITFSQDNHTLNSNLIKNLSKKQDMSKVVINSSNTFESINNSKLHTLVGASNDTAKRVAEESNVNTDNLRSKILANYDKRIFSKPLSPNKTVNENNTSKNNFVQMPCFSKKVISGKNYRTLSKKQFINISDVNRSVESLDKNNKLSIRFSNNVSLLSRDTKSSNKSKLRVFIEHSIQKK